ncbi:MAG TPA: tetratricopeptide repeat protein [Steroidobacteraceae bacterium]|nr:tetratricopeptide repeat protein [Steroidobacteraceae bacterium]
MAQISMKISSKLVVAAAALATSLLFVGAAAMGADKPQNSAKLAKPLKEAHDDLNAKKYPEAIAKLKEADGIAGKTPYDQHLINDMLAFAYIRTNNYADAARALEAEIEDGFTPPSEQQQKIRALSALNYQLKNYDKAIEFGQRALKGGFGEEETKKIVGQAYYLKGDWKDTLKFEEGLVDAAIKSGANPSSESLQLVLSACVKMEDPGCQTKALEKLVAYYPKPEYWQNLLFGLMKETASSDANTLQTFRLMNEVDVLKSPDDFIEMAQLAMDAGSPGEAQRALQRGFDKNVFADQRSKEKAQRLLEKAKQKSAGDQPTLEKIAKEADAAATGTKNNAMGVAYLGYGQYDKSVDQFTKAVSKGGLKNPAESQLDLGIAQLKAGHKEDAVKAFKAVKGEPILERLSSLWVLHARQAQ